MERSSSQLYVDGWDGIGLDGWLSKVVGSLRAPSVPIMVRWWTDVNQIKIRL